MQHDENATARNKDICSAEGMQVEQLTLAYSECVGDSTQVLSECMAKPTLTHKALVQANSKLASAEQSAMPYKSMFWALLIAFWTLRRRTRGVGVKKDKREVMRQLLAVPEESWWNCRDRRQSRIYGGAVKGWTCWRCTGNGGTSQGKGKPIGCTFC
jgi:hypothetical protein